MNKKNSKKKASLNKGYIFRNIITALAVINLVLLFGLNYNVPGFSYIITKIENNRDHIDGITESKATTEDKGNVTFEFADNTLTYDGKGEIDLYGDVTVSDAKGNELTKDGLSARITGDSDKEILYTYKSEDGQYYGTDIRTLKLENYEGPSIEIDGDVPTLTDDNLGKIAKICADICTVTDGYGNDISENLTVTALPDDEFNGIFVITFSVSNMFGDTVKVEKKTESEFHKPHLKIAEEEVRIKIGDSFDPEDYILYAVDYDGSDLSRQVVVDSDVDVQTLGDYKVEYDLTNDDEQSVKTKVLEVHVEE